MTGVQMIRPSQFVLVYGPGAILEGRSGPRIIPGALNGLFGGSGMSPETFEITDREMSAAVLDGRRIFRVPSNRRANRGQGEYMYRTGPFPRWRMCMNASRHDGAYLLYKEEGGWRGRLCPVCGDSRNVPGAARFVRACPEGHMDEVPWYRMVHGDGDCAGAARAGLQPALSGGDTFYYRSRGPISSVTLECPRCGARVGLRGAYGSGLPCSGRHPESEPPGSDEPRPTKCQATSRIIPRQASNLRIPVVETHFTIRQNATYVYNFINDNVAVRTELFGGGRPPPSGKEELLERLRWSYGQGDIPEHEMDEMRRASWEVLKDAIDGAQNRPGGGFLEMIAYEFRGLMHAAREGAPPRPLPNSERVWFEVERNSTEKVSGQGGRMLLVTPVRRLRTVTVQTGFRRMIRTDKPAGEPPEAKTVDIGFEFNGHTWYPGVEFLGEGLFITMADEAVRRPGDGAAGSWSGAGPDGYDPHLSQHGSFRELDPTFVWWHTLAHALTRAISEHAGYSSASIRERVYTEGRRGAILLYATQPGNDGTLGGLISLVPFFERILHDAMDGVSSCSGDPLCGRQEFAQGGLNGAACYGCVMNSETSCEHRNMWLDRHVLLEDRP